MKNILTTCPYCGCGCNFYLLVEDNEIIGITPSKSHPISKGKLCIKGWNSYEFVKSPHRLTQPLIKRNGKFQEVSWDEALELVAKNFKKIKQTYGPNSIGVLGSAKCTNEDNYLLMKFTRAVLGTNNIDHCARLCHAPTVVGLVEVFGSGAMTNSINEIEEADVILVTGSNTTEQHPQIGSRILNAVAQGARLILVDPRKIQLSKFAFLHLQQKPGTDVAWINGMMNIIIKNNLHDVDFIRRRTEDFEELAKVVKEYTPEYVEEITGIPKHDLIRAALVYAGHKKSMIIYCMGITQHTTGTDNVISLANLAMLCGKVGKLHTGVNPLRGQNNVQGACDVGVLPNVYTGYQKVTDEEVRLKFEKAWGVSLPKTVGLTLLEMIDKAGEGIKCMYIMGENPMLSDPDITHVKQALERLEFLVVQDIFLTETAELADVVLPGVSFAEKDGTYTNTERRVQRVHKAIEPLGNSKPDWQIICELSNKMGYPMNYTSPQEIAEEIAMLTPIYGGIYYDRLETDFGLQWPCPDRSHPGTKFLHKDKFTKGKGRFIPVEYKPQAELPDAEYPFILTTGRVYAHWHTGSITRKISTLHRECPTGYVEISPKDAERLNIKDGHKVKVTTRRGEVITKALVTEIVPEGILFMPFHFKESAANLLTNPAIDEKAKIPEFKVCAAKLSHEER